MNGISPWVAAAIDIFNDQDLPNIYHCTFNNYKFTVHNTGDCIWLQVQWPTEARIVLRVAYAPNDHLSINRVDRDGNHVTLSLKAVMGDITVRMNFPDASSPVFRYTTTLKAHKPLLIPFWPKDMIVLGKDGSSIAAKGNVHTQQVGTRSGLVYFSMEKPGTGSVLYMQNLTALNDYCQFTENSAADVVGGQWPELGFWLPATKKKPLPAAKEIIISDAFLAFSSEVPADEFAMSRLFMNLLTDIYLQLPLPATTLHKWPEILNKGLNDLQYNHACWSHAAGHSYLNAYVSDYKTPPELMVQLAVLSPLYEYKKWSKEGVSVIGDIKDGLDDFYDAKLKTLVRWHPAVASELDGSEEQLKPNVMDSWYLHHPLIHLSALALQGDALSRKLFLDSVDFTVKVARHFKYEWPVFYNMETLEVIKAETAEGMGGEHDVAGLYADVMIHAWELTKDERYLKEAKTAAKKLKGLGFSLFYQANNTAFAAKAMLCLYKITKEKQYLDLSYLCIANIFKNMHIWNCGYGYAKHYPTFFGIFPLNDAPYTAAYEEQEVFAIMHDYLKEAEGEDILPSIKLLLAEFIRYIVHRAAYYYPPNLPKEMLSDEVKMGQLDPRLWIALEDIHDGWEKSGEVGQEVYGAGVAFGIVPRHFHKVPGENFFVHIDYPVINFTTRKNGMASFTVQGDPRMTCRLAIVPCGDGPLPHFEIISAQAGGNDKLKATPATDSHVEYIIHGGQKVTLRWDAKQPSSPKKSKTDKTAQKKAA